MSNYLLIESHVQHADKAQQAFSSVRVPTLFNAIPAIESLHAAWNNRSEKLKYKAFHPALSEASKKLEAYYKKTADSDAHVFAMRKLSYICMNVILIGPQYYILRKR